MATVSFIAASDLTISNNTPLGSPAGGAGGQLDGQTITINSGAVLQSVEVADNEEFFSDNDLGPINGQTISDPLTSGLTEGEFIQAEYTLTLEAGGETFTALGVALGKGFKNVVGLAFVGDVPPVGVELSVIDTQEGPEAGAVAFDSLATVICFTPGTMILTEQGLRAIETLTAGDRIVTRDNGVQTLRWSGLSHLSAGQLKTAPHLAPVLIKADSFGPGLPARDMHVSPNHRFLVDGWRAQTLFGEGELLVRAQAMRNDRSIITDHSVSSVDYIHLMFDRHEIITADGVPTESFQPSLAVTDDLDAAVRNELLTLFPHLKTADLGDLAQPVRTTLTDSDARALLNS